VLPSPAYQHAADDRDGEVARALDAMPGAVTPAPDDDDPERSTG
jgi:hypothetical protein